MEKLKRPVKPRLCTIGSRGAMDSVPDFGSGGCGFDPRRGYVIHRSLMVRIAGFHPADPGSIPGDEDRLGMTLKAPKIAYSKKIKKIKIDTRFSPVRRRFCAICTTQGPVSSAW